MNDLLDPSAIERLKDSASPGQSREFVLEVIQLFLDAYQPILKKMHELIDQEDLPRIRKIAHQLQGLSLQVGATTMANICNKMECQDPVSFQDLKNDMDCLNSTANATKIALRALMMSFSASVQ